MADDVFDIDGVDALFDGALDDFVARRDALVKALKAEKRKDDAAAVKALRKPSAAAWAINTIARSSRDDMDALLRAGAFVREAQAAAMQGRDDGSLRTSTREWRAQVNALAARAGAHRDDAMVAFEAASTDDTVASVVCAGHLIAVPEAGGLAGLSGMPEPVTRLREPEARELEPEAPMEPQAEADEREPEVEAPVEPEPEPEPESPIFVPAKSIVIVGTPRSGSTLLARALEQTRVMGVPHEYWWRLVEARHADELSVATPTDENYIDYADAALLAGTTGNGVFSCKLFWEHQKDLVRRTGLMPHLADLAPVDRLWALFGPDVRAIYLRRNCLDAALSLWRAEVTDEWGRTDADDAPPAPDAVDVWRVSVLHAELHGADIGWPDLLRALPRPPLEITYDEVVGDLRGTVERIAEFADVTLRASTKVTEAFVQQADEDTERFKADWIAATGGCAMCA